MRKVRCTVESMNYSPCGMEVGDYFEVTSQGLILPEGKGFCFYAIASVAPLINGRLDTPDVDVWLATRPRVACPDPPENLIMRLELIAVGSDDE